MTGRLLLLAVLSRTPAIHVAARCGISHQRVSAWASGAAIPGEQARRILAQNYGIPPESWPIAKRQKNH